MQQINLYQPMFRQQRKVFSAVTMLQIVGFFVVVLGAVYAYNVHSLQPFRDELARTNAGFERLAARVDQMRSNASGSAELRLLDQDIARLTRDLEHRRRLQQVLASGSFGNTEGFSPYFEALARGHVDGAWLTDITLEKGGRRLGIGGLTVDPELVPVYLKRLGENPVFRKRGFNVLELARSENHERAVKFNIATGG